MSNLSFRPVWIHQSLRAGAQSKKRTASLLSGAIDHGFHYQGINQASLWQDVHRRHAPLFADPSFREIYRAMFAATASGLAGRAVHVIGLGAGGGEKEAWLLDALREQGCRLRYTPVDVSLELALLSAEIAEPFVEGEILPVVGDLSLLVDLPAWLARDQQEATGVYTAFGLTPNFLPSQLFPWLSGSLRERDCLLLNANLAPVDAGDDSGDAYRAACASILPQYDNPETRQWLRQILVNWGIAQDLSGPVFSIQANEGILGFVAHSTWLSNVHFLWDGADFQARRGDRLRLFFSLRYTPRLLGAALKGHGLSLGRGQITSCRQEGVWRVTRSNNET